LSDTCPQADVHRRLVACSGRCPTTLNTSGQTRLTPHSLTLKDALLRLKGAIPQLRLSKDRRYTFFELLTLTSD
jgi:hypothetical protein